MLQDPRETYLEKKKAHQERLRMLDLDAKRIAKKRQDALDGIAKCEAKIAALDEAAEKAKTADGNG